MVNRLLQPQEIEVFYILPAIRRDLAKCMKNDGKSQKEIAKLLGITEPAVSQYMSSKRASKLKFNDELSKEISKSSKLIKDETSLFTEIQRLLSVSRDHKVICQVHHVLGQAPTGCKACYGGKK
jgi:predicted transcriptional regulator